MPTDAELWLGLIGCYDSKEKPMPTPKLKCVKCDGQDIHMAWHKEEWDCLYRSRPAENRRREHLHYHCRNCYYEWTGPTADKKKEPKP